MADLKLRDKAKLALDRLMLQRSARNRAERLEKRVALEKWHVAEKKRTAKLVKKLPVISSHRQRLDDPTEKDAEVILERLARVAEKLERNLRFTPEPIYEDCSPEQLTELVEEFGKPSDRCGVDGCFRCRIQQRNYCFYNVKKTKRRCELKDKIPYTVKELERLKRRDLIMLAGIVGVKDPIKNKNLVNDIYQKQGDLE